ncbi:MAG: hypothetical protein WD468_01245 [Pirellulales bacterium]
MQTLHLESYPPQVAAVLAPDRLNELGAGQPNREVQPALRALSADDLAPAVTDRAMAEACLAGLWLLHDYLRESHAISQGIDTPTGSYWHAIMHRREGDFGNAKYWFRRVGKHPVFEPLLAAAREFAAEDDSEVSRFLAGKTVWDPFWFVDRCETSPGGAQEQVLRRFARAEWDLLFDYCFQIARGKP